MANPVTAWRDAEKLVFDRICTKTKTKLGKDAFRGRLPPGVFNAWALWSGGGPGEQTRGGCFGTLIVNAVIEARYMTRDDAMDFCGTVEVLLNETTNFYHIKNVQWFRLAPGGMPRVEDAAFTPSNGKPERLLLCYEASIGCELIYNTSTEY